MLINSIVKSVLLISNVVSFYGEFCISKAVYLAFSPSYAFFSHFSFHAFLLIHVSYFIFISFDGTLRINSESYLGRTCLVNYML